MISSRIRPVTLILLALALALTGCGGATETSTEKPAKPEVSGESDSKSSDSTSQSGTAAVDREMAERWPTAWCKAKVGMTRAQMIKLMGPPQSEFTLDQAAADGGDPQISWDFAEWQFNAFFDSDDKVRQLDANDFDLSPEKKAQIKCDLSRRAGS